ncbi:MAG: DUF2796 domain-containing protein [Henriciella sp.]|nr:DUF2796 domain-containing protein [Henriciella sp.]
MLRSSLFAAASVLVLTACQPASEAPTDTVVAETPPIEVEDVVEVVVEDTAANSEPVEVAVSDSDEETHDHDEAHSDDDHADEDHGDHVHDDDHDHDDHDHAGGEAHVHGLSDLAVSLDGNTVSISVEGALANFDLDETIRTLDDTALYSDNLVALVGGDCTRDQADVSIRPIGDHGNLMVDMVYSCADVSALQAIDVTAFGTFSGFEEVNAVILTETGQTASTLTASAARLDLP